MASLNTLQPVSRRIEHIYQESGGRFPARMALQWCVFQIEYDEQKEAKEMDAVSGSIMRTMNGIWHNRLRTWLGLKDHIWTRENAVNRILHMRRRCDKSKECLRWILAVSRHWRNRNNRVEGLRQVAFGARHVGAITLSADDYNLLCEGRRLSKGNRMILRQDVEET